MHLLQHHVVTSTPTPTAAPTCHSLLLLLTMHSIWINFTEYNILTKWNIEKLDKRNKKAGKNEISKPLITKFAENPE